MTNTGMPYVDLDTPTNAFFIKQALQESEAIDLYPEKEPLTEAEQYIEKLQEQYMTTMAVGDAKKAYYSNIKSFLETAKHDFLTLGIYTSYVEPVLESMYATSRQKDLALNAVEDLVNEEGTENLLSEFTHKNVYLAELADTVNRHYTALAERCDERIKEGLSDKDVCDIEDSDIKDFVVDCSHKVPKEITDDIFKRVEGAINDFIDDKKKNQFKIKRAYDDAKSKVDEFNKAQQVVNGIKQTDDDSASGSEDPEVGVNDNLMTKLDAQNQMDVMSQNDPTNTDPTTLGPNMMSPQQEAMASARATESEILEGCYNVFDGMLRIMVESCHKTKSIHDQYVNESGSSLDIQKIINDTKAMYTVLEATNTFSVIDVDEAYIKNMLHEMYLDSEKMAD